MEIRKDKWMEWDQTLDGRDPQTRFFFKNGRKVGEGI